MACIEAVVFDFDGVFTDNKVIISEEGIESVVCDRSDSLGIKIGGSNYKLLILSTETNPVVSKRVKNSEFLWSGCEDKAKFLKEWSIETKVDLEKTAFVGNDINDLGAMAVVSTSFAPADAYLEALNAADIVLSSSGGDGAVREVAELLLRYRP